MPPLLLQKAENPRGTVVLLNGCETHASLIKNMSTGLIEKGWNTLILDLPQTTHNKIASIIESSIQYASNQAGTAITLLGHGCDAPIILETAQKKSPHISAYITLGLSDESLTQKAYHFNAPLLDIHGSIETNKQDNPTWLKSIEQSGGRRMEIPTANDNFTEQESSLVFLISNWLKNQ